jgi:hypothetical protein
MRQPPFFNFIRKGNEALDPANPPMADARMPWLTAIPGG